MKTLFLIIALLPSLAFGGPKIPINKNHDVAILKSALESAGFTVKFTDVYSVAKNGSRLSVMKSNVHFSNDLNAGQLTTVNGIISAHTGPKTKRGNDIARFGVLNDKYEADTITPAEEKELFLLMFKMVKKLLSRMNSN